MKRLIKKAEDKQLLKFDTCLLVSDFLDPEQDISNEEAFEMAADSDLLARDQAQEELYEILGHEPEIVSCSFTEFDASNINHAGAHFEVEFMGTAEDAAKLAAYEQEMEGE